jgi:hypothetical protein
MNYTWKVESVEVDESKLVNLVFLVVTGAEGDNTASASLNCYLTRSNSFIPFDQLTEQQVLDWCFTPIVTTWKDIDGIEYTTTRSVKDEGETQVAEQIARQLAQKQIAPALPWAQIQA